MSGSSTIPAPGILVGDRVVVRPYTENDAAAMYEAINESSQTLRPWMPWADSHASVTDSLEYIRQCQLGFLLRSDFPMGTFARADGRYLGGTGIHINDPAVPSFEIGYWIRMSAQGQGLVSEAVRLLTVCAFESLHGERLVISCDARNDRSRRVAERQGYVLEGRHRKVHRDTAGALVDTLVFALVREDFERVRRTWTRASG